MTDMLDLDVLSLSHDGRAVCRDGQRVIFARGGLPGQKIRVCLTHARKRFAEGQCVEVLAPAPDAVPAACAHAGACGGCPLQEMPISAQHYWKGRILTEALTRIGKVVDPPVEKIVPSPQSWGYRNKMEFAFAPAGGAGESAPLRLGLRSGGSHAVCDTRHCLLLPEGGMAVLDTVRRLAAHSGLPVWDEGTEKGCWRFVVLRMPRAAGIDGKPQVLVTVITGSVTDLAGDEAAVRASVEALGRQLMEEHAQVTGFVHEERCSAALLAQGERTLCTLGVTELRESLGGRDFAVDHGGFFQVNTHAAEALCTLAQEMAGSHGSGVLWDLYCGVGAPGLTLAQGFQSLYGVESAPAAVAMAKRNAATAGFAHCRYEAGDVRRVLPRLPRPHTVLLDPPRAGLHADVVRGLLKAAPQCMVYISCNPATLARDVALLDPAWRVARVVPVDLFPQTPHVESVTLLLPRS